MGWQDTTGTHGPADSVARWSGGRKWGDGSRWGTPGDWTAPYMTGPVWNFEVAIGGIAGTWSAIRFRRGRDDWFGTLRSTTASITVNGYAVPAVGASVVIGDANSLHWVGYVESSEAAQRSDGTWVTTIACVDTVGRLGKAEVTDASIPSGTLVTQVEYLLGLAGIDAAVEQDAGISLPTLDAVSPFTGAVLDHIARAEKSSNALLFMRPNGDLRVTQRVALPDYGDRVVAGTYVTAPSSHWALDETSGTLADAIGGVTGTASGSPTYNLEGPWGSTGPGALGFDDSDDYVSFGDNYDLTGTAWTIAGWAYWNGLGSPDDDYILYKVSGGDGWLLYVSSSTGRLDFVARSASAEITDIPDDAPSCPEQEWFQWAVVRDGSDMYLYVNGSEVARGTISGAIPNTAASLILGGLTTSQSFGGRLAQVSVWNATSLTTDELRALMTTDAVDLDDEYTSPSEWRLRLSQDTVYNSWQLEKENGTVVLNEDHAASIAAYGLRAYAVTDYLLSTYAHFPSGLRTATEEPRLVLAGAPFPVEGYYSHRIMALEPLDIVGRDGQMWQVMSVDHDITPSTWTITITGDSTRDGIATAILETPAPPEAPVDEVTTKTITQSIEATRDATAYRSSGGARYGNGTGDRLQVGIYAGGRGRAFIRFPISWPTGFIRVKKAILKLRTGPQDWVAFGSDPRMYVQRVKEDWSEGSFDAPEPNQFSSNALEWPGPDRTSVGQKVKDVTRAESTWIEIAITDIAQDWHDVANHGLALVSVNEDSAARTTEFYSRESGSEPRLVLTCEVEV